MKIDILPIKIKFEKDEEKYSKLYKSYHYMNYGYCEIDGEIYFYYWDYKDDYLKSNELILELNKAILKAIKLTEEKDFAEKNAMNLCKTFSGISKMLTAMYSTIREVTLSFVQSEAFQIVKSVIIILLFVLSFASVSSSSHNPFIYFNF